jgi:hypothetical protein
VLPRINVQDKGAGACRSGQVICIGLVSARPFVTIRTPIAFTTWMQVRIRSTPRCKAEGRLEATHNRFGPFLALNLLGFLFT